MRSIEKKNSVVFYLCTERYKYKYTRSKLTGFLLKKTTNFILNNKASNNPTEKSEVHKL